MPTSLNNSTWPLHSTQYGILTGIGFTMSLFVGNLAFPNSDVIDGVKIGVLLGSLFSTLLGYAMLISCTKIKNATA